MKNKILLIIISLTICISISGCLSNKKIEVDLSDIEQMNIGSEMPWLLYANDNIAVMQGTFGIIVYNINDSIVTNRISYEDIKPYGISMIAASVSQDGSTIYIGNEEMSDDFIFTHQYDISTGKVKNTTQEQRNLFKPIVIGAPGYNKQYDKYFDLNYLIGYMIVELDDSFIYLRSKDWEMKNLEIVRQYKSGESEIFNIFE